MTVSPPFSATDRFSMVIDGLCRAVAARIAGAGLSAALIVLIWGRLRRIERRVQALVAAIRAGRLRAPAARAPEVRVRGARGPALPRGFGWLLKAVPYEAACFAGQLRAVLEEPEMTALLAATPRMGRMLRPLCRMLGLEAELVAASNAVAVPAVVESATRGPPPVARTELHPTARTEPQPVGGFCART